MRMGAHSCTKNGAYVSHALLLLNRFQEFLHVGILQYKFSMFRFYNPNFTDTVCTVWARPM